MLGIEAPAFDEGGEERAVATPFGQRQFLLQRDLLVMPGTASCTVSTGTSHNGRWSSLDVLTA